MKNKNNLTLLPFLLVATVIAVIGAGVSIDYKFKNNEIHKTAIANPFVNCNSLEDAIQLSGINIDIPATIGDYEPVKYMAIQDELIQIVYAYNQNDITIRKASGVEVETLSGDYNTYATEAVIKVNDHDVTIKYDTTDAVKVAYCSDDNYAYSITTSSEDLNQDVLAKIISIITR